jgi:hypothetical protein
MPVGPLQSVRRSALLQHLSVIFSGTIISRPALIDCPFAGPHLDFRTAQMNRCIQPVPTFAWPLIPEAAKPRCAAVELVPILTWPTGHHCPRLVPYTEANDENTSPTSGRHRPRLLPYCSQPLKWPACVLEKLAANRPAADRPMLFCCGLSKQGTVRDRADGWPTCVQLNGCVIVSTMRDQADAWLYHGRR